MELLSNFELGFGVALTWANVGWCLLGVVLGTLVGVLPGIGPVATIAMLLPVTFHLSPVAALIMVVMSVLAWTETDVVWNESTVSGAGLLPSYIGGTCKA